MTCHLQVVRMDYLDAQDGWQQLHELEGHWDVVESLALAALERLHSCLDGKAVHGDLNPMNVFVRCC